MQGFRQFVEHEFFNTIKKQLKVPKKLWYGMPFLVYNAKIGNYHIVKPTMFFVTDFNRESVTISSMKDEPFNIDNLEDFDDEIDMSTDNEPIEATISRADFEKLSMPDSPPADGGMPPMM